MCLAIPGKIVELKQKGKIAVVDYSGEKREAANIIHARIGETVLVQHKAVVEIFKE
jgi:hydrogenase maturation factor